MSYNDERSYINFTLAAQNIVSTASNAVVAGATVALLPIAEPTYICSVAGVATANVASLPAANGRFFVVVGTNTTTGGLTVPYAQSSASSGMSTFIPPVFCAAGSAFTVGLICTGTASATESACATTGVVGLGPQYV